MSISKTLATEFIGTFWPVLGGGGGAMLVAAFPNVRIGQGRYLAVSAVPRTGASLGGGAGRRGGPIRRSGARDLVPLREIDTAAMATRPPPDRRRGCGAPRAGPRPWRPCTAAPIVWAGQHVDRKRSSHEGRPGQLRSGGGARGGSRRGNDNGSGAARPVVAHDLGTPPPMWLKHPMIERQVDLGAEGS
jgi:hypothetical protein